MFLAKFRRILARRINVLARARRHRRRPTALTVPEQLEGRLVPSASALQNIDHVVVIYQENWSFDSLYGFFPGANGIGNATDSSENLLPQYQQVDKSGAVITTVPQPLGPDGKPDLRFPSTLPANPYDVVPFIKTGTASDPAGLTGDIIHRFYHEQLQIDNGALQPGTTSNMNKFVTWSDNQGLVLSYIDSTNLPEGQLAQQYTLDDNFFHAAYGGSFLNHQFLIAAAAPQWNQPIPAGFQSSFDPTTGALNDSNLTIDGKYVVNTTRPLQAPHLPTDNPAKLLDPINDNHPFNADGTPDPTYTPTIGDRLDDAGVSWRWYSGGWTNALEGHPDTAPFGGGFQFHHQPFAYYANFAPLNPDGTQNPETSSLLNPNAHLQDETQFFADLAQGDLPAVSFIKPLGANNEHPGYSSELQGQQHVADIVHAVQNSDDWAHTAIVITYDENGGRWDHVSPPKLGDGTWGDGTRVPAIVISPYAQSGFVDHTQHDTLSILKTIEERFHLQPLNSLDANASDLNSSLQNTPHSSIGSAYAQIDASNPGKFALIVQGTESSDKISISLDSGEIRVQIKGQDVNFDHFFAQPLSRIEIYGQAGNDKITVASDVTMPAYIFAGSGDNKVQGGGGQTAIVGGSGDNQLTGGVGASIIIGGSGHEQLTTGSGAALLIAGTTLFDANPEAIRALEAEWSRTDETFAQKLAHLNGGATGGQNVLPGSSQAVILDTNTVQSHGGKDVITRHGDTGAQDLILAHLFGKRTDKIDDIDAAAIINLPWSHQDDD
jgi:phospholipase C